MAGPTERTMAARALIAGVAALLAACGSEVTGNGPTGTAGSGGGIAGSGGLTSSGGGSGGAGIGGVGGSGGTGGGGAVMILEPSTMEFFQLPLGSLRYAVAGQDMASDSCVALIWFYGSFGDEWQQNCAASDPLAWPYVVITPNAQAPCLQFDTSGNVDVGDADGCVQFVDTMPTSADVEVTVQVSGALFTGTIVADNVP